MTTFLLLLKCFFKSILSTLLRVVLPSVTILLFRYSFKILFTPLITGSDADAQLCLYINNMSNDCFQLFSRFIS